jgi:hypothetical protein
MHPPRPNELFLGTLRLRPFLFSLVLCSCGDRFASFDDLRPSETPVLAQSGSTGHPEGSGGVAAGGSTSAQSSTAGAGTATVGAIIGGYPDSESGGAADAAAGAPSFTVTSEPLDLIDDVEGPFPKLPQRAGRNGAWFLVHDDTAGKVGPASALALNPARGTSHFAANVSGAGFTGWGAQLGVALRSPVAGYDATAYCGVRFFAKGSGAGWTLQISDRQSSPQGGVCVDGSYDVSKQCYDYLGKAFTPTGEWQMVELRFAELGLVHGFTGKNRKLDSAALYDILFNFEDAAGGPFELLVDDLSFTEKTPSGCL